MRNFCLSIALLAGAWWVGACAQSRPKTDGVSSETHFLRSCSGDSCGKGLTCVCGACTKACDATSACTALAKGAVCAMPADDACDEGRTCDVKCSAKADCAPLGDAYACADGRCRAPATPSKPDATDPGLAYGPCTDNPMCGNGTGIVNQGSDGTCICTILCDSNADCPKPGTGTAAPECVISDFRINGHLGQCDLHCSGSERCPDGATCQAGSCRFFNRSGCQGPCADPGNRCTLDVVAGWFASSEMIDCGTLAIGASSAERSAALACVRNALDAKGAFSLIWQEQGTDSELQGGLLGVSQEGPDYFIERLSYDSAGTSPDGAMAHYSPCTTFSLRDDCTGELSACFQCDQQFDQACSCSEAPGTKMPTGLCLGGVPDGGTAIEPAACPANTCNFDGVCYPDQTGTEDGCCYCDKATGGGCDEPAWCPGWVLIGKRCSKDADCSLQATASSGLRCRTDFFGERGVCTRDCNFGCPTGTECVADVPDYNGGTVHNVCMRRCSAPADCAMEPRGNALGSECDAPGGLSSSYCF